jgi:hypothetical protein
MQTEIGMFDAWVSGSKWASPDGKFVWCPSGQPMLSNVTYDNVTQSGIVAANYQVIASIRSINKVVDYLFYELSPNSVAAVYCELP